MYSRLLFPLLAATLLCAAQTRTRIALVGDSTVNDEGGWGPGFETSFSPQVETLNFAKNGRSSKSFRNEGLWEPVLAAKPNFVLIQFGHNDGAGKGPERETDPKTTFRANLLRYMEDAEAAGAQPILVTSIVRRNFDTEGKIRRDSLVPFVEEVRSVAAEKRVPLIDLYAITLKQSEEFGPARTAVYNAGTKDGKPDTTHLGAEGQMAIGILAAREFARVVPAMQAHFHELVPWRRAMDQKPQWYSGPEATRIATNLLSYQHANGGWDKNIEMAAPMTPFRMKDIEKLKSAGQTTIDNDATYIQIRFLARVYTATKDQRFREAVQRGLNYLLEAQYPNGGWPQFYPLRPGYYTHITYNDDAMIGVMQTLRMIVDRHRDFAFMAAEDRDRCRRAIEKGVACILKTQVTQKDRLTAWCAQHDEATLAPAKARTYELPSLSGSESVGIVQFLMAIDHPSPEIIRSVQAAVAWFASSKITGIRLERKSEPGSPKGFDTVVVPDPHAPPLWARFYELETNRPMFCDRDGVRKYSLAEIGYERRNGYRWYVDRPARLLDREYPAWMTKWARRQDAGIAAQ